MPQPAELPKPEQGEQFGVFKPRFLQALAGESEQVQFAAWRLVDFTQRLKHRKKDPNYLEDNRSRLLAKAAFGAFSTLSSDLDRELLASKIKDSVLQWKFTYPDLIDEKTIEAT